MLHIEITDDECAEGEAYIFNVPLDTDKGEIMAAIAVFYPNATSVWIGVEEED